MNWLLGLERTSAVLWGGFGLFFFGIGVYLLSESEFKSGMLFMAGAVVAGTLAHKITCWILRGFFSGRRP